MFKLKLVIVNMENEQFEAEFGLQYHTTYKNAINSGEKIIKQFKSIGE